VSKYGIQLLVVIVLSTWIGMAITAIVLRALMREESTKEEHLD
jgi:holin-like protein